MTTGTLKTRNGRYHAIVCFNNDGAQKQKSISTGLPAVAGNKRKAEKFLKEQVEKFDTINIDNAKILFMDFMEDWLEIHRANIEDITYAGYRRHLSFISAFFKDLKISLVDLKPIDIEKYKAMRLKTVSPNTVIKELILIRAGLEYARKIRVIKENVADLVEKPKKQKFISGNYNQEEIIELLRVIKGTPIEIPVMFAAYFGLTRSEILGIKWSAIDLQNRTLTINHRVVPIHLDGKCKLDSSDNLKTKFRYRTMNLDETFYNFLTGLKEKQEANKKLFGSSYNRSYKNYVCVNDVGNIIQPNYVTKAFKELLQKNDMKVIRFHDLRHSCALLLLHLGYNFKDVQLLLGHGEIGTTINIYAQGYSLKSDVVNGISNAYNS